MADAPDWRWPCGDFREEDGSPCSLDVDDARTTLENPDIWVPSGTKREDGLQGKNEEEDTEEPRREENGENTEDLEKKADDDRRNGNSVVPREAADQGRKGKNRDMLTDCHAPRGTWLTKVHRRSTLLGFRKPGLYEVKSLKWKMTMWTWEY
ncbi:hypothetical protein NDU88_010065 [Pleurodeles waltl]|uniref:Uncharacterized protein n=1 Tax=Pleurodeles waltl TaxID=8319 RepID=A0AAV7QUV2_PLEWA|nr:hypothetical protein NDU88_010065 [Pleurodeles waltl]